MLDVILHIVHADESVTDEEEIVLDEINAMIMAFVSIEDPGARFEIVLVPQTETQTALIESLLPGTEALARHGGMVYRVGEISFKPLRRSGGEEIYRFRTVYDQT